MKQKNSQGNKTFRGMKGIGMTSRRQSQNNGDSSDSEDSDNPNFNIQKAIKKQIEQKVVQEKLDADPDL